MAGLENTTSNLLTVSRITWSQGRLQSAMLGGTNGTIAHLVIADAEASDADYAFEVGLGLGPGLGPGLGLGLGLGLGPGLGLGLGLGLANPNLKPNQHAQPRSSSPARRA